ncbi:hypothetical protein HY489_06090 [Candidatus Woesearchaeota archaeon]|nr:hypothetical protein [Candidatus Woesearchaeota archaeon]
MKDETIMRIMDWAARPYAQLYEQLVDPMSQAYAERARIKGDLTSLGRKDEDWLAYRFGSPVDPSEYERLREQLARVQQEITQYEQGQNTPDLERRLDQHRRTKNVFATGANAATTIAAGTMGAALLNDNNPVGLIFLVPAAYFAMITVAEPLLFRNLRR